jgi:hypothetical protein
MFIKGVDDILSKLEGYVEIEKYSSIWQPHMAIAIINFNI